ncbi:uncharacterized protein LOC134241313 [Saccostrea cucullata]|uniref:uncharacterized protein LOC134241313 n=1 Tax=Saccostrea cuccullata TaxID=36930 RepID=UPI002ED60FE1
MATSTPRKTCVLSDTCILCGFSFIQIERKENGEEKVHKFFETKLRLNTERIDNIKQLTGLTDIDVTTNAGVYKKCYRSVESIMKTESKNEQIKQRFREVAQRTIQTLTLQLLSPRRKSITKRMLRSPSLPSSKKQTFDVSYGKLVEIAPFKDLTNRTDLQKTELPLTYQPPSCSSFTGIPIAPKEKQGMLKKFEVVNSTNE